MIKFICEKHEWESEKRSCPICQKERKPCEIEPEEDFKKLEKQIDEVMIEPPKLQEEWEKEFDKIEYTGIGGFDKIKDFIRTEKQKSFEQGMSEATPEYKKDMEDAFDAGKLAEREKVLEIIDIHKDRWKKCERKNCNNKSECKRANHYIETIWNPIFAEIKKLINQD